MYTENVNGINVHKYGAHIFHTSDKRVWNFVNSFVEFNRYTNSPVANYHGKIYNLPFNMNTFYAMWGVVSPKEAQAKIEEQRADYIAELHRQGVFEPRNLEEQAISLVGKDIYYTLIKEYTEKQWGRNATDLPAFIIKRLPVRLTYDNNYFNDLYQGIPIGGYTALIEKMLGDTEIRLEADYFADRDYFDSIADRIIFTGEIDRYFDYRFGHLEYRTVTFETKLLEGVANYQGNAVVNYTDGETPYTRIIEHKHFEFKTGKGTVITREYPAPWKKGEDPYYPINDEKNTALYARYEELAKAEKNVVFGGRLGQYRYYDMDKVIRSALDLAARDA